MKIAVTFFRNKRKKQNIVYHKDEHIYSNIQNQFSIKGYEMVIVLIISIYIIFNWTSIISLSSNMFRIKNIEISPSNIMAMNSLINLDNYIFSKDEVKEEKIEIALPEEQAMDELANLYNEQVVFNNVKSEDIKITAQTENYQKMNVCGVDIVNYSTNRNIDFQKILNSEDITLNKNIDEVLLYTTHTSESYANSEKYSFNYTSPRRTTDGNYNMLAISKNLASNLNSKGINTVCSLTPHDYGEYNSAYSNSRMTFETLITENPNINVAIDVHRDAIEDLDFAPKTNIKGYDVASLMLVMGIGYEEDGYNPYYEQNLKLAFQIYILANKIYPGLFRAMIIRNSIYNQDIRNNSFLVEVGASGNTIDEAKLATRCLANLINIIYRD